MSKDTKNEGEGESHAPSDIAATSGGGPLCGPGEGDEVVAAGGDMGGGVMGGTWRLFGDMMALVGDKATLRTGG